MKRTLTAITGLITLTFAAAFSARAASTSASGNQRNDNKPPTVSLTAPSNNATVSGSSVTVSANASDRVGVTGVQFKLDGNNLGAEDTSAPYSVTWDTTSTADGSHTLSAVARDAAGNNATSAAVTVLVSNGRGGGASGNTFYVDSDWKGTQSGTASQPWQYLSSSAWSAINSALGSGDVSVYFSARKAASDSDDIYDTNGDGSQDGIDLTMKSYTGSSVLTLDGNSKYNTSESSPNWAAYSGESKSRLRYLTAQNSAHLKYSNITIHGFHVATTDAHKEIAICGDNWIVENCECEHTSSSSDGPGILLVPTADSTHEGSSAYAPACNNIIIRNNVVHDTFGESLYIGGGGVMDGSSGAGYPSHSNVTIEGNTIYNCGSRGGQGDGIDVKGGIKNLIIRANEIYNLSGSGVRAIVMQGQRSGASQTTVIERNRIHDCNRIEDGAIALSDSWGIPQGVNIRNNVISKVNAAGIKVYASQDTVGIYNNTIASCGSVAILSYAPVSVINNLVYGNNGGGSQVSLSSGSCDFNAYGGNWGDASVGSSSMTLSSTQWGSTVTSPSSGDFSLKSTAPVIGKAKVLSTFSNDLLDNPRGSSWDIGAYEYVASPAGSIAPAASTSSAHDATLSLSSNTAGGSDRIRVVEPEAAMANAAVSSESADASPAYVVWLDDALPAGAQPDADGGDDWTWSSGDPTPLSGSQTHQSALAGGLHEHYFDGATDSLSVNAGDQLFVYVYLDPSNPPSEVMLQWSDGSWEHRAYWGADLIASGANETATQYYMGALPAAGQWVRLEVPASAVGLEGRTVTGMAFTLYGGRAFWDAAGKSSEAH